MRKERYYTYISNCSNLCPTVFLQQPMTRLHMHEVKLSCCMCNKSKCMRVTTLTGLLLMFMYLEHCLFLVLHFVSVNLAHCVHYGK